jgi:hypothetical protein
MTAASKPAGQIKNLCVNYGKRRQTAVNPKMSNTKSIDGHRNLSAIL